MPPEADPKLQPHSLGRAPPSGEGSYGRVPKRTDQSSKAAPPPPILKLIDFGLSVRMTSFDILENTPVYDGEAGETVGTQYYQAPEAVDGGAFVRKNHWNASLVKKWRAQSDLWSLGVLLHIMLTGSPPSFGAAKAGERSQTGIFAENLSADCRDLLEALLQRDWRKRVPSCAAVLEHAWFKRRGHLPRELNIRTETEEAGFRRSQFEEERFLGSSPSSLPVGSLESHPSVESSVESGLGRKKVSYMDVYYAVGTSLMTPVLSAEQLEVGADTSESEGGDGIAAHAVGEDVAENDIAEHGLHQCSVAKSVVQQSTS